MSATGLFHLGMAVQITSLRLRLDLQFVETAIPIIFRGQIFEFDLADSSKSGIIIYNSPIVLFDDCTFIARSAMGPFFDTLAHYKVQRHKNSH